MPPSSRSDSIRMFIKNTILSMKTILILIAEALYVIILVIVFVIVLVWCIGMSVRDWWKKKTF